METWIFSLFFPKVLNDYNQSFTRINSMLTHVDLFQNKNKFTQFMYIYFIDANSRLRQYTSIYECMSTDRYCTFYKCTCPKETRIEDTWRQK